MIDMNRSSLRTIEQIQAFLADTSDVHSALPAEERARRTFVEEVLRSFRYPGLDRAAPVSRAGSATRMWPCWRNSIVCTTRSRGPLCVNVTWNTFLLEFTVQGSITHGSSTGIFDEPRSVDSEPRHPVTRPTSS